MLNVPMFDFRPIALSKDEKESMKKLKYLKYTNNPKPVNTPRVVYKEAFLELLALWTAIPRKKIINVATNSKGTILQSAYP
jgi:hypothetical protein